MGTNIMSAELFYNMVAAMDGLVLGCWMLAAILVVLTLLTKSVFPQLSPPPMEMPSQHFWRVLIPLALLVRLPRLVFDSYWYDETFTAAMANVRLEDFWTALSGDVHPPLFYLMSWLISQISRAEWAFRLPSLLAGMALIYVVYKLSLQLFQDESIGKLSALLVAFMPAMIHYSAEARYPMLLALSICVAWLAMLKKRSLLVALAAIIAALLHATGIIYAFIFGLWLSIDGIHEEESKNWFVASLTIIFGNALIVSLILSQASDLQNGFWLWQMVPLAHITEGTVLRPIVGNEGLILALSYAGIDFLSILASMLIIQTSNKARYSFFLIAFAVPAIMFVLGYVFRPVYLPRALLASVIPLLIGMAALARRNIIFGVLVLSIMIVSTSLYFAPNKETDLRALFARCEGSDYTYTTATNMAIISLYYAPSPSLTFADGNNQHQELPETSRAALGFDFTPPEILAGADSVCLVVAWNYYTTEAERQRVESLRRYQASSEIVEENIFWRYEVIWLSMR